MRHRSGKITLDRKKAPREALLRGLTESVILYEKVTTTPAKARAVRPLVEHAITIGKKVSLANRRTLMKFFYTENSVNKILDVLGPRYAQRPGGYTRMVKLSPRQGDGQEMVRIELV